MSYTYNDKFKRPNRELPVAYYRQRSKPSSSLGSLVKDSDGNYIFVAPHNHAEFEIIHVSKGAGYVKVLPENTKYEFDDGDFIIFNPFEVHSGIFYASNTEVSHSCMDFSIYLLDHPLSAELKMISESFLQRTMKCENIIKKDDPIYTDVKKCYDAMFTAGDKEITDELMLISSLYSLFTVLYESGKIYCVENTESFDSNIEFVKTVLTYIDKHYMENVHTRDIAKFVGYSKEHFCRLFKAYLSTSFTSYLTQYRIEKAKKFLVERNSTAVSEMCGFTNQSIFAKLFRESVGMTPSEYRKFITED